MQNPKAYRLLDSWHLWNSSRWCKDAVKMTKLWLRSRLWHNNVLIIGQWTVLSSSSSTGKACYRVGLRDRHLVSIALWSCSRLLRRKVKMRLLTVTSSPVIIVADYSLLFAKIPLKQYPSCFISASLNSSMWLTDVNSCNKRLRGRHRFGLLSDANLWYDKVKKCGKTGWSVVW